jgi:hypothetical protein
VKEYLLSIVDCVDNKIQAPGQIELEVEELEVEELEGATASFVVGSNQTHTGSNHNETAVSDEVELGAEELEEAIALFITYNQNGTLVVDEVKLSIEGLEGVIAP